MKRSCSIIILAAIVMCLALSGCGFNWQWLMHGSGDSSGKQAEDVETPSP